MKSRQHRGHQRAWVAALLLWTLACGKSNNTSSGGSGGSAGAGGTTGMGGSATGGAIGAGGAGHGGATNTGGNGSTGGVSGGGSGGGAGGGSGQGGTLAATGGAIGVGGGTAGQSGKDAGAMTGGAIGGTPGDDASATGGRVATDGPTNSGAGGRPGWACQAGAQYPAPALTGTPKQINKSSESSSGTYEGPVWLKDASVLLMSNITFTSPINPSQMLKLTPPSTVETFLQDAGTNGMAVDKNGVVFACSHKVQGIVKVDVAGAALTTVVATIGGKKFNSPNDLVLRSDGTIYFTDPDYQLGNRTSETGKKGVYRVDPAGTVTLVDDTFSMPNGITLSPDEKVLYVADNNASVLRTFNVATDGSTSGRKDFAQVNNPDGIGMDCAGNLYVASNSAGIIQVFAPSGSKLGSMTVASSLSNIAFGGSEGKTLYATAGKALYSLDMNLPGYPD
jgi:gluconolactonase